MASALFVNTAEAQLTYRFYWTGADGADNDFTTPGNWDHQKPYGDPMVRARNCYQRHNIRAADSGDLEDDNHSGTRSYVYAYAGDVIDFTGFDLPNDSQERVRRTFLGRDDAGGLGDPVVFNIHASEYTNNDRFNVGDGNETNGADAIINVYGTGRLTALRENDTDGGLAMGWGGYTGTLNMYDSSTAELRGVHLGIESGGVGRIFVNDNAVCTIGVYWSMPQVESLFSFGDEQSYIELNDNGKLVVRGDRVQELTNYMSFGLIRDGGGVGLDLEFVCDNFCQNNPDFGYPTGWTHVTIKPDSDGDGVPDDMDDCPNTPPDTAVDANGCPPTIPGDFDEDGDVDNGDIALFEFCGSGPSVPAIVLCQDMDLDMDGDVDQDDFGIVQRCHTGQNNPGDPSCAD